MSLQMSPFSTIFTLKDQQSILDAERSQYEAKLRALKIQGNALRRGLRDGMMSQEAFDDLKLQNSRQVDEAAQALVLMTDATYVETIWKCLDKTTVPQQVYGIVTRMLERHALQTEKGTGRKSHENSKVMDAVRAHYKAYEPDMYQRYMRNKADNNGRDDTYPKSSLQIHCPVLNDFRPTSDVRNRPQRILSHILPASLGEQNVCAILGYDPDENPLYSMGNLLYLDAKVEEALDLGYITFIPVAAVQGELVDYKVIVINKAILSNIVRQSIRWKDLDGRQLQFRSNNRPAKRIVYLHNVIVYLRAQVLKWEGYETLQSRLFDSPAYATPTAFLRGDMLRYLAQVEAENLPENLARHTFETGPFETWRPSSNYLVRRSKELKILLHELDLEVQDLPKILLHLEESDLSDQEDEEDDMFDGTIDTANWSSYDKAYTAARNRDFGVDEVMKKYYH